MDYAAAEQEMKNKIELAHRLCDWFDENARVLPWRSSATPYHVWISEIMLQQTRVEAVKRYYERFTGRLPDVKALAECPEDEYLKLWEGLGYYSRVRNLHAAAVSVMEEYGGELPASFEKLLKLKGIGSYTAGAIASIAFGLPEPAVDGNVLRVLMRLLDCDWDIARADTKKQVEQMLRIWLKEENMMPGKLNQALMEIGALVCVPNGAPHCEECPWQKECKTRQEQDWEAIPVKTPKKPRKIEEMTVLVLQNQEGIYFRKRPEKGLLAGLYEFPNVSGSLDQKQALKAVEEMGLKPIRIRRIDDAKHIFTHIEWHMIGYEVLVESEADQNRNTEEQMLFVDIETAREQFAIPSAFRAYKKYIGV